MTCGSPTTRTETRSPTCGASPPMVRARTTVGVPAPSRRSSTRESWPKYSVRVTSPVQGPVPGAPSSSCSGRREHLARPGGGGPGHRQRPEGALDHPVAEEPREEARLTERECRSVTRRRAVHLGRGPHLGQPALVHDRDLVGERERLALVVGDEHDRGPLPAQRRGDGVPGGGAQLGVQGGERLVEQDDARPAGEGARQRHPLLLAAGQLVRPAPGDVAGEPDELEQLAHPGPVPALGAGEPVGDVPRDVEVGEEVALLRDVAEAPLLRRHPGAGTGDEVVAEPHLAGLGPHEARHDAQQRRLSAAGRSDHGRRRAGGDDEVDAVEDPRARVGGVDARHPQAPHDSGSSWPLRSSSQVRGADRTTSAAANGAAAA